jgi:GAF domain-containing protein
MAGRDDLTARLREFSEAGLAAATVEDVVGAFLAAVRALLGVDQVHLIEVSQDAAVGHARVVAYEAGGPREDAYVMVLDERPSGTTRAVTTGDVVHVPDAATSNDLRRDYSERFGVGSALFVPLAWAGDVRWVAVLIRRHAGAFADGQIEAARLVASVAASALARVEAAETAGARDRRDAALVDAAAALNTGGDLVGVLEAICRAADVALGGDMAGVYLGDGERGGVATAGHQSPAGWDGYVMAPGEGVAGRALATGLAAITSAYQRDVRLPENPGLRDLRTAVAVPIRRGETVVGALSVGFLRMRRVAPPDVATLEALADLAGAACRLADR